MSGHSNVDALTAFRLSEYGMVLTPFQDDYERVYSWLAGWRSAPSLEIKGIWVHRFETVAVLALGSGLLAFEEYEQIFHEVFRVEPGVVSPGMGLPTPRGTPDYSPEMNLALPAVSPPEVTPDYSPESNLATPAISPPEQQPEQKKRRGRPVGSKDVTERARRGTQKSWTKAEKSKNSRENLKKRKAIVAQQEQQQLQAPPPGYALPPPPPPPPPPFF